MVTEVHLNEDQKRSLEQQLADIYQREGIETTGMEVLWIHRFDDGEYRINYVYEDNKNQERRQDFYGKFMICRTSITDLVESK